MIITKLFISYLNSTLARYRENSTVCTQLIIYLINYFDSTHIYMLLINYTN